VKLATVGSRKGGGDEPGFGEFPGGEDAKQLLLNFNAGAGGLDSGGEVVMTAFILQDSDPGVGDTAEFSQGALDFRRSDFFAADIGDFSATAQQAKFAVAIPFAQIRKRGFARRAVYRDATIAADLHLYTGQRFADATATECGGAGAVVADAAGFRRTVKIVDFYSVAAVE